MAVAGLVGAAWTIGPYVYADRDHTASIDSAEVRAHTTAACGDMQVRMAEGISPYDAGRAMVARVRTLDPEVIAADVPTEAWLADWDLLLDSVQDGRDVPKVDGARITRRMDELVKDLRPCQVPDVLRLGRFG